MATYYISPSGSDSNPGTITQPYFTLNKAWSMISAGDIVYMRGGTYNYTTTQSLQDKDGAYGNMISILAYPNEFPVFNFSGADQYNGIFMRHTDHIHIKGIRITNLPQCSGTSSGTVGFMGYDDINHCVFENMEVDHIEGTGVGLTGTSTANEFLNCDSHHNQDPNPQGGGDAYGGSDGFWSILTNASCSITYRNCRAWWNSDDGWDNRYSNGTVAWLNCWSFWNGFIPDTFTSAGNGDGFKCGGTNGVPTGSILRTLRSCIAYGNRQTGITPEPDSDQDIVGIEITNCIAYDNASSGGAGIQSGNYSNYARIRNCIDYDNNGAGVWIQEGSVDDHNSWNLSVTVNDADFVSVSSTGIDGPRQSDGSLPVLNFLHLVSGSDLRGKGVVISGLTTDGNGNLWNNPPSLGAFEYGSTATVLVTSLTVSSGASVINSYHGTIQMSVTNILPSNATNKTFSWSVNNGLASIDSSGLLTAITNGVVTVRATALDGSGVSNTKDITISNQTVTGYPSVVTSPARPVNKTTASAGGTVTSDGGATVTAKGICYSTSANPTLSDTVITLGSGAGTFSTLITGLSHQTYHIRAYATNSSGTSYGQDVTVIPRAFSIVII